MRVRIHLGVNNISFDLFNARDWVLFVFYNSSLVSFWLSWLLLVAKVLASITASFCVLSTLFLIFLMNSFINVIGGFLSLPFLLAICNNKWTLNLNWWVRERFLMVDLTFNLRGVKRWLGWIVRFGFILNIVSEIVVLSMLLMVIFNRRECIWGIQNWILWI